MLYWDHKERMVTVMAEENEHNRSFIPLNSVRVFFMKGFGIVGLEESRAMPQDSKPSKRSLTLWLDDLFNYIAEQGYVFENDSRPEPAPT